MPDTTVQFTVPLSLLKPSTVYVVTLSGRNLLGQSEEVLFSYTTEGMVCCCLLSVVVCLLFVCFVVEIHCGRMMLLQLFVVTLLCLTTCSRALSELSNLTVL